MFYYHSLSNSNQQAVLISYGSFVVSFYFILFSTFLFKFYSNQFSSSFNFLIKFFYFCFSLKQGLYYGTKYFIEERYKLKFSIIQVSFFSLIFAVPFISFISRDFTVSVWITVFEQLFISGLILPRLLDFNFTRCNVILHHNQIRYESNRKQMIV